MLRCRSSDWVLGLLIALGVFSVWVGFVLNGGVHDALFGGDFSQFYTAGLIVDRGEVDRLYDQPHFKEVQRPWREKGMLSIYPPTVALVMSPLGRLSYVDARAVWWAIQAACFLVAGWLLYRMMPLARPWKINAMVAMAGLLPVWIAICSGHLVPLLLLILTSGIALHQGGRRAWAGAVLSLLALKPQFAVGIFIWLALRRDGRSLLGMAAGLAAQGLSIAILLGPRVPLDYLANMHQVTQYVRSFSYSPIFEQSPSGITSNLLKLAGYTWNQHVVPMQIVHVLSAGTACVLLCRVVWIVRPWEPRELPAWARRYEYACAVLLLVLFTPYVLVYDMTLLCVPLALIWSSPKWPVGVALFATMTAAAAAVYLVTGFSVTCLAALWTMFELTTALRPLEGLPVEGIAMPGKIQFDIRGT